MAKRTQKKKKGAAASQGAVKKQARQFIRNNDLANASKLLTRLCKEDPSDHEAWLLLGSLASRSGQHDKAIRYCQTAVARKPQSASAHNQLGKVYRDTGMPDEAIASFHSALERMPDYPEAHQNLTDVLLSENRHHELINACRKALEFTPEDAELHCKLAVGLEQAHQLEQARAAAGEALGIAPGHTRAALTLAKIDKRSNNLQQARERLEKLQYANLTPPQLSAVLGELGDVLDRLGEYSKAYSAFQGANQAMLQMVDPALLSSNTIFDTINRYRSVITEEFTRNWADCEPDDGIASPIFLVGFPRSGTTLTEQIITSSKSIVPSDEEAMIYQVIQDIPKVLDRTFTFPDDLDGLSSAELTSLRQHYWKLTGEMVKAEIGDKRLLDKLPLNLIDIAFIYRLFPSSPVVVVLRDPRDCCMSGFMRGFVPNQSMIHFSTLEGAARFYAAVMQYWLQIRSFPGASYLELRYEDLVADLEVTARQLIAHIGGEWNDSVLRYFEHSRKRAVRTPSYSDIAKPIFSRAVGRWRNYQTQLAPAIPTLLPFIKEFGYSE